MRVSADHKRLMRRVKFPVRVGIEFTTIPQSLYYGRDYLRGETDVQQWRQQLGVGYEKIDNDPGCIEVSSEILTGWPEVIEFASACLRLAKDTGCKQDSPYSTGGGGHIHISYPDWTLSWNEDSDARRIAHQLQYWLTKQPWVAWAMNDPSDNSEARLGDWYWRGAASCSGDNVELRFFDGVRSVEEQIEHVALAIRLLQLGAKLQYAVDSRHDMPRIHRPNLKVALAGWKQTIEELALPWKLYRKYSRNIRERYQLGPRYLN